MLKQVIPNFNSGLAARVREAFELDDGLVRYLYNPTNTSNT